MREVAARQSIQHAEEEPLGSDAVSSWTAALLMVARHCPDFIPAQRRPFIRPSTGVGSQYRLIASFIPVLMGRHGRPLFPQRHQPRDFLASRTITSAWRAVAGPRSLASLFRRSASQHSARQAKHGSEREGRQGVHRTKYLLAGKARLVGRCLQMEPEKEAGAVGGGKERTISNRAGSTPRGAA